MRYEYFHVIRVDRSATRSNVVHIFTLPFLWIIFFERRKKNKILFIIESVLFATFVFVCVCVFQFAIFAAVLMSNVWCIYYDFFSRQQANGTHIWKHRKRNIYVVLLWQCEACFPYSRAKHITESRRNLFVYDFSRYKIGIQVIAQPAHCVLIYSAFV